MVISDIAPARHAGDVAVTVDLVIFTIRDDRLQVLLVERGKEPFLGMSALPGGYVRDGETLDRTARGPAELCRGPVIAKRYAELRACEEVGTQHAQLAERQTPPENAPAYAPQFGGELLILLSERAKAATRGAHDSR